jgi:hypothetical protein
MARKDATDRTGVPPKTEDEVIEAIKRLMPSAHGDRTLAFWRIGDELGNLRRDPGDQVTTEVHRGTQLSVRELRYCKNVREAFTYDRLESLVAKGLRWSSARELASESLKPYRNGLIARFEAEDLSNAELLAEAIALRKGGSGAAQKDAGDSGRERRIQRAAAQVAAQSAGLRKDLIKAGRLLQGGTAGASAAANGPWGKATGEQVRAMNAALAGLLAEAAALLRQSTALAGEERPPPPQPDKARRTTAAQNPGTRPVRARGGKRRQ